jgi:hypothetical protein
MQVRGVKRGTNLHAHSPESVGLPEGLLTVSLGRCLRNESLERILRLFGVIAVRIRSISQLGGGVFCSTH